jgi:hypothetical protein
MTATQIHLATWPASLESENEDSAIATPEMAIVVDGAGLPESMRKGCSHSVAWFSRALASTFQHQLNELGASMRGALSAAITSVANSHEQTCDLTKGSPSATLAAWRIRGDNLEFIVLCDSSLLLYCQDGSIQEVTDSRLHQIVEPQVEAVLAEQFQSGSKATREEILTVRGALLDKLRNKPGGYWCCHTDAAAANEAITGSVPLASLRGVILATDGAMRGFHELGIHTLDEIVQGAMSDAPTELLSQIRSAEREQRESLSSRAIKIHDDATFVSMSLD